MQYAAESGDIIEVIRRESNLLKVNPSAMKTKLRSMKVKFRTLLKRCGDRQKDETDQKENDPNLAKKPETTTLDKPTTSKTTIPEDCTICLGKFEEQ